MDMKNTCCRANIKVSSTETGAIFGNIVYESTGHSDRSVVVLNDIHIDIMDYISPASCPDVQFRSMWAEFEWENKVGPAFECLLPPVSHACLCWMTARRMAACCGHPVKRAVDVRLSRLCGQTSITSGPQLLKGWIAWDTSLWLEQGWRSAALLS